MKLVLSLVILCLAGGVSSKSVQDLQSELLQAIREMIEDPPQGEDGPPYSEEEEDTPEDNIVDTPVEIIVDPMPPNTEEEAPPGEDNTIDPMPPNTEEEAPPAEDNIVDPMPPNTEEEEAPPDEDNTIDPMPPSSEGEEAPPGEDNVLDPMPPYSEEEEVPPGEDNIVDPMPPNTEEEEAPPGEDNIVDPMPPFSEGEEDAPPGDDNTIDPMPPNTEEEDAPPGEDNTIDPMPPNTEEEEAPPGEDNTIDPMPPFSEEEEDAPPGEDNTIDPMPPSSEGEESDAAEDMGPSLTDGEEEDPPAAKQTVQDLESELLQAIRQMIEDPETLQAGREVESNKVQDVTMKVTYKGEESEEKVSFDDVTGSETILVSARSDMEEANIRHCFNEGLSLECFSGNSKCYLMSIASEGEPDLQQQKEDMAKFLEESPSGSVSADDVPEVTINWVEKEKVSREDLPACLADFQPDFAVFSAVKAPADEGTVTDDRGDAGLAQEGKRYVSGGSQQCARGACPIRKQVQKQGSCYYSCYRWVCNYFSTECVCCPEVTQASQCLVCRD